MIYNAYWKPLSLRSPVMSVHSRKNLPKIGQRVTSRWWSCVYEMVHWSWYIGEFPFFLLDRWFSVHYRTPVSAFDRISVIYTEKRKRKATNFTTVSDFQSNRFDPSYVYETVYLSTSAVVDCTLWFWRSVPTNAVHSLSRDFFFYRSTRQRQSTIFRTNRIRRDQKHSQSGRVIEITKPLMWKSVNRVRSSRISYVSW